MFFSLESKVAIVTGAHQGVGLAIAKRFVEAGAKVMMADINDKAGEKASEIGAEFLKIDVSEEAQVKRLMEETVQKFGKIDILMCNTTCCSRPFKARTNNIITGATVCPPCNNDRKAELMRQLIKIVTKKLYNTNQG